MANIVLIDVSGWQGGVESGVHYPNIGIAYLISALKTVGHEVTVFDMNNQAIPDAQIFNCLAKGDVTLVGLSVKTATMGNARNLGRRIKSDYPHIPIIVGGPHATVAATMVAAESWVDYVLLGEGEIILPELCTRLESHLSVAGLDGVLICGSGGMNTDCVVARVNNLEDLAYPDYSMFGKGILQSIRENYPLVTSRGCPYKCTYCSVARISGNKVRTRSPAHIVDELFFVRDRYGVNGFEIIDDCFNVDIDRAKIFCRLLIEKRIGISWTCPNGIRADRIDTELADLMAKSGCKSVMVGVESADPVILGAAKKGESVEKIEEGICLLKEANISVGGFFIIGLPGDSFVAQERSVEFIRKNKISAFFNVLVPYPGTEVYDWVYTHARLLKSIEDGGHYAASPEKISPVFDTVDFTVEERCRAYEMVHTRLSRFDLVIPKRFGRVRFFLNKIYLLLKYDRPQLLSLVRYMLIRR